ncbi:MAG: alpha-2,8-polysialyltransferase family protein [Clostridia bacterium]|nr:alpha-2,8-polysialyltransferase family protein [Clostridia bacterium]
MTRIGKRRIILIAVLGAVIIACLAVFLCLYFTVWKVEMDMAAEQVEDGQVIRVGWDTDKQVSKVTIEVSHEGTAVTKVTLTGSGQILKGECDVDAFYGRQTVKVKVTKGVYTATQEETVELSAPEYNIAPLTSTMPVTIFSAALTEVTADYTIPTFVWFTRSSAWDYSALPENVYTMPIASPDEITGGTGRNTIFTRTAAWVKELYDINPDSVFHLYYTDLYCNGWLQATVANGIPEENYDLTLISDGAISFQMFNRHFNNEDDAANEQEYETMKETYATLLEQISAAGKYENTDDFAVSWDDIGDYAYIMCREYDNISWWLTRVSGTLATANDDMYAEVSEAVDAGQIRVMDLGTLLAAMTEDEQAQLHALYNFSDEMFEEAQSSGKKIMLILGTYDENEWFFDDYVKAIMDCYGDGYVYYYKGHPRNPTTAEKNEHLQELGLTDVESTIPAEFILFFTPDIYVTGYASSTFVSVDEDKACLVWVNYNTDGTITDINGSIGRREDLNEPYIYDVQGFISPLKTTDEDYGCLVPDGSSDTYFLIQYNSADCDLAVYDATTSAYTYYILSEDGTLAEYLPAE